MAGAADAGWESIYRENVGWVYRLLYGRVGNRPDAEDLTTEVFLAALRPLRATATVPEVRAYLVATARSVLASYWRRTLGRILTTLDDVAVEEAFDDTEARSGQTARVA